MASGWDTSANIISEAARALGLISAAVANPYASTDANLLQLCILLHELGQDLLRDFDWSHLQKTHTFATVNGTAAYDLPTDYVRTLPETHWNRSEQQVLLGPVGATGWQYLKAVSSTTVNQIFRIFNDQINIHPTPSSAETVAFEYVSRFWVKETGQSSPNTESADAATDTLYFDRRLLVTGLKVRFLEAKGLPSQAAQRAYEDALARAQGGDGAQPTLNISEQGLRIGGRLLDGYNIPDTGYGS